MKLTILLLLISTQGIATTKFNSLNFINEKSKFRGETKLKVSSTDIDVTYQSVNIKAETDSTSVEQRLIYGVSDQLSIGLQLEYFLKEDTDVTLGTPIGGFNSGEAESPGLADPFIGAAYRVLGESSDPVNLDIELRLSPGLGDGEIGTTNQDGNQKRGGTEFSLKIGAGRFFNPKFEGYIDLQLTNTGDRDVKDLSDNSTVSYDSTTDFELNFNLQYYPKENFRIFGGLGIVMLDDVEYTTPDSVVTTFEYDTGFSFNLGVGFMAIKDKLDFSLQYADTTVDVDAFDSSDTTVVFNGDASNSTVALTGMYYF